MTWLRYMIMGACVMIGSFTFFSAWASFYLGATEYKDWTLFRGIKNFCGHGLATCILFATIAWLWKL